MPTCTSNGHKAGKRCSVCGTVISGMEVIETKGHTWYTFHRVEPTCSMRGTTEGKCKGL